VGILEEDVRSRTLGPATLASPGSPAQVRAWRPGRCRGDSPSFVAKPGAQPAYVRGEAYLLAHDGTAAAAEFQKLLDHRGIVQNFVTGSLVHLQIGRAYSMAGDKAKALIAYQDFLTLWKDADPDVPTLKQAKAEYAKLQ